MLIILLRFLVTLKHYVCNFVCIVFVILFYFVCNFVLCIVLSVCVCYFVFFVYFSTTATGYIPTCS